MGVFRNLYEAIEYIRKNGWAEYRAARKRYDEHQRFKGYSEARYSKAQEISFQREMKKRKNR